LSLQFCIGNLHIGSFVLHDIGYIGITVRPDEYDSRHNGIDFQRSHLRNLPVLSADNICNIYPHFTHSHIRILP